MAKDYFSPDKRNFTHLRTSSSCAHKLDYHYVFATKYRRPVLVGEVEDVLRDLVIGICLENELWGRGYSVETVGRSNVAQINAYLQSQEAHHTEDQIDCS